jgi:hypothetical protein
MWMVYIHIYIHTYLYHSVRSLSVVGNEIVLRRPNAMEWNYSFFSWRQCHILSIIALYNV